jgi:transposase
MLSSPEISIQTINHLGLVAGIIDDIGIEEIINEIIGLDSKDSSSPPAPITITKGYSRDHRPDLKQFIIDLIVSGDGGIPLFLRVADGNEQDKVIFGEIAVEYKSMIDFETMIVADSALYTVKNLQLMSSIKWLSRVPLSHRKAKELVNNVLDNELTQSSIEGYSWKEEVITYGEIKQRWLLVESQKRKESDLKKLSERIEKEKEKRHRKKIFSNYNNS